MRWVSSRRQAALHTHFCQRSVYLLTTGVAQFQSKTAQGRQGTFSFLMPPLPCRLDVCTWGCRLTTALTSRQLEPVGHPEWPFHGVWWGDYRDALKCLKLNSSWERTGRYLRSSVELHVRPCGCNVARGTPRGCAMTSAPADHLQDCGWHRGGRRGWRGRWEMPLIHPDLPAHT